MKLRTLYSLLLFAIALIFHSCDDSLQQIGYTIQPGSDKLGVATDTLALQARTVQVDSVYTRTKYPVLGEYTDPIFGTIKADYATEFYYPENLDFESGAQIDSVRLTVSYSSIIGDSLAPMNLEVYKITKELERNRDYTSIDPATFSDMSAPLGQQIFTGKNPTSRTETYYVGTTPQQIVVYDIHVKLTDTSIGEDFKTFLNNYKNTNGGKLPDTDVFREFFPGLYVTTDFGYSTLLNVSQTSLSVHYKYLDKNGSSKNEDTIRTKAFRLNATPEVLQMNHIQNRNDQLLANDPTATYIKSPAGVNTEIVFPFSQIHTKLEAQALNQARLVVYAMPEANAERTVKLSPPSYLLLINKDSLFVDNLAENGFFEKRKLPDSMTSYLARFNSSTYSYDFGNISGLINHYNRLKDEPFDLTYYLVPVDATFATDQYGQATATPISVYNQMMPSAVKIDKSPEKLKLEMIFSSY